MGETRCPHCQVLLPEAGTFCGQCGRRLADAPPPPEASSPASDPAATLRLDPARLSQPAQLAQRTATAAPVPGATRAVPPERVAPTPRPAQPRRGASRDATTLELETSAPPRPRLLGGLALIALLGTLAASAGYWVYRRLLPPAEPSAPQEGPEVVKDEPAAPAALPETAAPAATPGEDPRPQRLGRTQATASTTTPSPSSAGATRAAAPATAAPATPATAPPAAPAAPIAAPATPPAKAASSPTAAAPATPPSATPTTVPAAPPPSLPHDGEEENVPPSEEELDEERQALVMIEGIRFVLRSHRVQVQGCYERAFKNEPTSPSARVDIDFTIERDGRARRIKTTTNTSGSELLSGCLEQLLGQWKFPQPPAGDFATSYPFVFSGGG